MTIKTNATATKTKILGRRTSMDKIYYYYYYYYYVSWSDFSYLYIAHADHVHDRS